MLPKKQFNSAVARLRDIATTTDLIQMLAHQLIRANDNGEHNELLALLSKTSPQFEGKPLLDRRRAENYLANALYGRNHSQIAHLLPKEDETLPEQVFEEPPVYDRRLEEAHYERKNRDLFERMTAMHNLLAYKLYTVPSAAGDRKEGDTLRLTQVAAKYNLGEGDAYNDARDWICNTLKSFFVTNLSTSDDPTVKSFVATLKQTLAELRNKRAMRCEGTTFFEAMARVRKEAMETGRNLYDLDSMTAWKLHDHDSVLPRGAKQYHASIELGGNKSEQHILIRLIAYDTKDALSLVDSNRELPDQPPAHVLVKGEVYVDGMLYSNSEAHPEFWLLVIADLLWRLPLFCMVIGLDLETDMTH